MSWKSALARQPLTIVEALVDGVTGLSQDHLDFHETMEAYRVAKTQLSLSDDPKRIGRPADFDVTVREVRLSAGAGFVVALLGDIMTMPGLPKEPSAKKVRLDPDGTIRGLMQNE